MTDRIEDGGPAFPTEPRGTVYGRRYDGMTLRDWFAGQALASIPLRGWNVEERGDEAVIRQWAETSYAVADAMLEARK